MKTIKTFGAAAKHCCLRAFAALLFLVTSYSVQAQCTLVSSLSITSGWDGTTLLAPVQNDPHWMITDRSPVFGGTTGLPMSALIVNPVSGWGTGLGARWLCDASSHATPGVVAYAGDYILYSRSFRLCEDGDITFDMNFYDDNLISAVYVDGVAVPGFSQPFSGTNYFTAWPVAFTQTLSAGTHTFEVRVEETNTSPVGGNNPIGMCVNGTISAAGNIIVDDYNPDCVGYECQPDNCSDECYWKVKGNTILNGNHIFGTKNQFSVDIKTENSYRGILTPGGPNNVDPNAGRMGWNTMNPTARLHVDCQYGNNWDNAPNATSDIRFENLEPGSGTILVIDDKGYVYNSRVPLQGADGAMKTEIEQLKTEVAELKAQVASYRGAMTQTGNVLYQNAPNPFGKETVIGYDLQTMQQAAYIIIYDLTGRELMKYPAAKGKGQVTISGEKLQPGMYLYSLIVDGKEADTKRMVVSK